MPDIYRMQNFFTPPILIVSGLLWVAIYGAIIWSLQRHRDAFRNPPTAQPGV
jgi:uncharacterized membrane protein YphA (DoxX/SURF4 family)